MKSILLLLLLFTLSSEILLGQMAFSRFFEKGAIRYDYEFVGDKNSTEVIFQQLKALKHWGGNPAFLIEDLDLGSFNYQLFDVKSGELIFQKGFCSLFMEWQTTAEAAQIKKSFYQSLFFPKPLNDVYIVINNRDSLNNWAPIYSDTLKTSNYFIKTERPVSYPSDTIVNNGSPADCIDIVILAEGYTPNEMEKFERDAKRLSDSLFLAEPFRKYSERFNVVAVKVPSLESGADIPGNQVYKNTAFNAHYYTFDSPRYLTSTDMKSIYDALDGFAWDQIYLLVNTERYGGGGFYNTLNICSADNDRSPFVFCHEFGHGFAGLGDEYYTSETSYEDFMDKKLEPWEPNLTTLVGFDSKWESMIADTISVPTPRDSLHTNVVGVFEGGGYDAKGIYSPVMSCWMKEQSAGAFCPVCQSAIEKVILRHSK